jgi:putative ABC transport system permease protein
VSDHPRPTALSRLLARCYPRELREQYAEDIARFIDDARRDPRYRDNPLHGTRIALSLTRDALQSLFASLRNDAPRPLRSLHDDTSFIKQFRSYTMEAFWQDIRFAFRGFVRRPAFTAIALITLTLGIGGNSAIFTLVNSVLLQSLPYPEPDQLVNIWGADEKTKQTLISVPNFEDLTARNRTFESMGIARSQSVNLTGGDKPDRVVGNFITAPSLRMLGPKMALGRIFSDEETKIGAGEQVVVVAYDTWQSRYGGRKDMLGQTLVLNGRPHVVIGVTAQGFRDPLYCDIWLPITSAPSRGWFQRDNAAVWGIGRLKPGVTLEEGQRDLANVASQMAVEQRLADTKSTITLIDMRESIVGGSRFTLIVLFGAVAAVLLIVCVNIANLQLVRASTRQREMSVRAAMGANRTRLISQTLTESLILSLIGGALGIVVGQIAVKALVTVIPTTIPLLKPLVPDARVMLFTMGTAVLTGLMFGLPAAFAGTKSDLQSALRARTEQASTRRFNARNILVVSELALCIVLLTVAGLFTRSLQSVQAVNAGYIGEQVLTAEFRLPAVRYDDSVKVTQFMNTALENLRNVPGVVSAALVDAVPLSGNFDNVPFVAEGRPEPAPGTAPVAGFTSVSDKYFETLQISLLSGRDFNNFDRVGTEPVIIVNKIFADESWPGQNPIGKSVRLLFGPDVTARVIGVVAPIKQFTLTEKAQPQVYAAKQQNAGIFASVVMRTTGDPNTMGDALRGAIWAVDRDQPIWKVRSLQSLIDRDLNPAKFSMTIISGFALLALLLGTIGVYGVMSFAVQQRSREMGIRMALGARGNQVLQLVLRGGMEVVVVAVLVGFLGALAAGQLIKAQLFNVGAHDPITFAAVPLVLGAVAMLACWLPARRAARVDPAVTLRAE